MINQTDQLKQKKCTCKNSNTFIHLGGELVKVTKDGLEITKFKRDKPRCIDCGGIKNI